MNRLSKILLLLFVIIATCLVNNVYADIPPKPLWTPEDAVTIPMVILKDVSSDGKYSLLALQHTSLTEGAAEESSDCVLINNENLEMRTINKVGESCFPLQFVREGKAFSYILYDKENKRFLFVQDVSSQKDILVQELKEDFNNYSFAPDGKSFAFIHKE
ncbi:MAG: hypothetical protein K2W92_05005, partial [Alphaproteobacteria bacterium]|nr:hypothetical protein [Alphaproteobacteria bacterium]